MTRVTLNELKTRAERLASSVPIVDEEATWSEVVGSTEIEAWPVHRWYRYKEGFSPRLPRIALERFGAGKGGIVLDPFAGVATTQLALREDPRVTKVIGIELSPIAQFVGALKLAVGRTDVTVLRDSVRRLRRFDTRKEQPIPKLSSFSNPEIFDAGRLNEVLSVLHAVQSDRDLTDLHRDFLMTGIASVIEVASNAMKDGRALRILRDRKRRRVSLTPVRDAEPGSSVRALVVNQWLAMLEDLEHAPTDPTAESRHLKGDARDLARLASAAGLTHGSVGLTLFSPPYLNGLDYSEVYKLELWLLGFIKSREEHRLLRGQTLRSHARIKFEDRATLDVESAALEFGRDATTYLRENLDRPETGQIVSSYLEDMSVVLKESYNFAEPGGRLVCIVGNSTFASHASVDDQSVEAWRLAIETDVLLAQIARDVGWTDVHVLKARSLRPRNVRGGSARESLVIGTKEAENGRR